MVHVDCINRTKICAWFLNLRRYNLGEGGGCGGGSLIRWSSSLHWSLWDHIPFLVSIPYLLLCLGKYCYNIYWQTNINKYIIILYIIIMHSSLSLPPGIAQPISPWRQRREGGRDQCRQLSPSPGPGTWPGQGGAAPGCSWSRNPSNQSRRLSPHLHVHMYGMEGRYDEWRHLQPSTISLFLMKGLGELYTQAAQGMAWAIFGFQGNPHDS